MFRIYDLGYSPCRFTLDGKYIQLLCLNKYTVSTRAYVTHLLLFTATLWALIELLTDATLCFS